MLNDHKIINYTQGVTDLSNYPSDDGITAEMLKAVFDARSDNEIKDKHNGLIDALNDILPEKAEKEELEPLATKEEVRTLREELTEEINKKEDATKLGQLAYKDIANEEDLGDELKAKVNDAYNLRHSHDNKAALDEISAERIVKWDNAQERAEAYAEEASIYAEEEAKKYTDKKIKEKLTSVYKAGGTMTFEELSSQLENLNLEGYVFNVSNDFTTTEDFVEGAGKEYKAGTNVVLIDWNSIIPGRLRCDVLSMSLEGLVTEEEFGSIDRALDAILELQNMLIGGAAE